MQKLLRDLENLYDDLPTYDEANVVGRAIKMIKGQEKKLIYRGKVMGTLKNRTKDLERRLTMAGKRIRELEDEIDPLGKRGIFK